MAAADVLANNNTTNSKSSSSPSTQQSKQSGENKNEENDENKTTDGSGETNKTSAQELGEVVVDENLIEQQPETASNNLAEKTDNTEIR